MKNCAKLPEGYEESLKIDLQQDKKRALLVNGLAALIFIVMIACAALIVPFHWAFLDMGNFWIKLAAFLGGSVLYIFLHELVHGLFMGLFSREKPHYGFTGLYAYAGSDGYFNKAPYIVVALAPLFLWGIVLLTLNFMVPPAWFWIVYLIQCYNVSGSAGDIYVAWKISRMPSSILVHDTGVAMTVYMPKEK